MIKFSDDTALLSLLQGAASDHGTALPDFVDWCDKSFLDLNVTKTTELVIDFRKNSLPPLPSVVHGEDVEVVESYKYLGTIFDNQLKFDRNTESLVKRSQQRMFLLRKLNSFSVSRPILQTVYQSFIESLLTFSFICWYNGLSVRDKNSLNNIVKVCSKIIGSQQRSLHSLFEERVVHRAKGIIGSDHVLSREFSLLPLGRRYKAPPRKTNRYANSFVPSAIRLLNGAS